MQIVKLEMYNFAEGITLGSLLSEEMPKAKFTSETFAKRLLSQYQTKAGYYATRVYLGGITHKFPFLRWPQAQLFYSMTNLLASKEGQ